MPNGKRQEDIQHTLRKELVAFQDDELLSELEELTYKPDPDPEHSPLSKTETTQAEMEEVIEVEGLHGVDELIDECLTEMMTEMIPRYSATLSQDWLKTNPIMCNIVYSALDKSISVNTSTTLSVNV